MAVVVKCSNKCFPPISSIRVTILTRISPIFRILGEGRYDVVFAVQVLHLIDREGLEKIVSNFADITARVVVMLPSRNAFKRYILDAFFGLKKAADATFLSEPRDVYKAMQVKFHRESFSKFPLLAEFSVWHRREHRDM